MLFRSGTSPSTSPVAGERLFSISVRGGGGGDEDGPEGGTVVTAMVSSWPPSYPDSGRAALVLAFANLLQGDLPMPAMPVAMLTTDMISASVSWMPILIDALSCVTVIDLAALVIPNCVIMPVTCAS